MTVADVLPADAVTVTERGVLPVAHTQVSGDIGSRWLPAVLAVRDPQVRRPIGGHAVAGGLHGAQVIKGVPVAFYVPPGSRLPIFHPLLVTGIHPFDLIWLIEFAAVLDVEGVSAYLRLIFLLLVVAGGLDAYGCRRRDRFASAASG